MFILNETTDKRRFKDFLSLEQYIHNLIYSCQALSEQYYNREQIKYIWHKIIVFACSGKNSWI